MRTYCFILFALCFFTLHAFGQKRKVFRVNPGEKPVEVIPKNEQYTNADFKEGVVFFKNGAKTVSKLNYNSLYGEMQFIDAKGDTVSIADEALIQSIIVQTDTFYFDKVCLKQINTYGDFKLANRSYFVFLNRQRLGGMGETTSASVNTYTSVTGSNYFRELVAQELLTLGKYNTYYIGDRFNRFTLLNKKALLEYYSKNAPAVQAYLKENKVDFESEDDIKKMLNYFATTFSN